MGLIDIAFENPLALDTNILITAFNEPEGISGKTLSKIKEISPQVYISTLVFEEFLVKIYKKKLEKDLASYEDFITGGGLFIVVSVDRQIARKAAQIRARFNLKAPDAIHLASAIESKAKVFVTADRRIPRKIDNLNIVSLV